MWPSTTRRTRRRPTSRSRRSDLATAGSDPAHFLTARRYALAGASRGGRKFGNTLLREMRRRGLAVFPLHPEALELDGMPCHPGLDQLPEPAEALVVCVPPARALGLLREAAAAGVRRVWMQPGSSSRETAALAAELGLECVTDRCLLMHLEPVRGLHAIHRWLARRWGRR
jgi:predicted CoA-binding protein